MSITSRQTSSISQSFLRRLIGFYKPRGFNSNSTQFDVGYEQAKADLRRIIMAEVPDIREYENFAVDPEKAPVHDPEYKKKERTWWW